MNKKLLATFTAAFAALIVNAANTWYVDCQMADYTGHDGKSSEKAFKTIMEAVTPAASGDTIWVHPGTYNSGTGTCVSSWGWSRVGWNNKKLFLRSTDGAEKTIIEGHKNFDIKNGGSAEGNGVGAMRCFSVYNNTTATYGSVLQGFTFKGGETLDNQAGAGTKEFVFANGLAANALTFSYAGEDGYAEILNANCLGGFVMLLK
ncbi:MAG: hypothetical protein PHN85_09690 [Kiritimatiellae bacterium]|nr:hypothetical protein [Kiritimatiellia bacterium]